MNYSLLKDEIVNDPLGRGYAALDDVGVAGDLNMVYRMRDRETMTIREISNEFVKTEWDALAGGQKDDVLDVLSQEEINPFGIWVDMFVEYFGNGSQTITNLAAARVEQISRAAELGLPIVYEGHVASARNL